MVRVTVPRKVVATGIWLYGGTVPKRIEIYAKPAEFAYSRFDEDEEFKQTAPVPETLDGFLYQTSEGDCGEHQTIAGAKAWADAQPWGPVKWDDTPSVFS
jgi:hypothetical protein